MPEDAIHRGGCFCGAVQIAVHGPPVAVGICHCESCRRWLAAPVNAWAVWPDAKVEVSAGEDLLLEFNKQGDGGPSGRTSCRRCGGALLNRKRQVGATVVYSMALDGSGLAFEPTFHCYYGEGVLHFADGLPKYAGLPASLGGSDERCDEAKQSGVR